MTSPKYIVKVCHGGTCSKNFAYDISKKIETAIEKKQSQNMTTEECRCMGLCGQAPNIAVFETETGRFKVKTNLNPGKVVEELEKYF